MVVTGDRDVYQLVDDGVRVMATSRGITDTKVYDREGVIDRYGIPPELIPDFIGLKGDTSDNIPGVPGIGDKTAAQLLQQFGSLEEVLAHVDEISGAKRKENLTDHADDARVSKQLATAVARRRRADRRSPRSCARARPLAAARGVPRVRAARRAAAPRGASGDEACPARRPRRRSRSTPWRGSPARPRRRADRDRDRRRALGAAATVRQVVAGAARRPRRAGRRASRRSR